MSLNPPGAQPRLRLPEHWEVGAAVRWYVGEQVPGYVFHTRLDGADFAVFPEGSSRLAGVGVGDRELPMTSDTILHAASMSKPICVTAYLAMLEDWRPVAGTVAALRAGRRVLQLPVTLELRDGRVVDFPFPVALIPVFGNRRLAQRLVIDGLRAVLPGPAAGALDAFISGDAVPTTPPRRVPGFVAFLASALAGATVPDLDDPFLPLLADQLRATATGLNVPYAPGAGVDAVTIRQVILHQSTLRNGVTDPSRFTLIPSARPHQPNGGAAIFDLWAYLLAFLGQPADAGHGYKNDDYTVLGALVQRCTGMAYDDYVVARLFTDPRFDCLRRYVVAPDMGALYYGGVGPDWTGGVFLCDYRGWSAAGGFYFTARQITDWLHALYTREAVAGPSGPAPLISLATHDLLFGAQPLFAAGASNVVNDFVTYTHNGGTGVGGGSANGNMGIAVRGSQVITAFFGANGSINGGAAYQAGFVPCTQEAGISRVPPPTLP